MDGSRSEVSPSAASRPGSLAGGALSIGMERRSAGSTSGSEHGGEEEWERISVTGSASEAGDHEVDAVLEEFMMVGIGENDPGGAGAWDRLAELEVTSRHSSRPQSAASGSQPTSTSVVFAKQLCQGPFGVRRTSRRVASAKRQQWRIAPAGAPAAASASTYPAGVV